MFLTQLALDKLNTVTNRVALAAELGCGEQTIINNIKWNKDDGLLTKKTALLKIEELTGMSESEILTEATIPEIAKSSA